MRFSFVPLCFSFLLMCRAEGEFKKPSVLISILVRNKAHTLPYFLSSIERLNYPKSRLSLWFRSDHNIDNSLEILRTWIASVKDDYHSINTEFVEEDDSFPDEKGPTHWSRSRFNHVINLREIALNFARKIWADYYFTIDCDVFLTNPETLNYLIAKSLTIVSPMLRSDGLYSNFWAGMTDDYYYHRTDDYKPLLYRETVGCFPVPMIHSCVLIDLRRSETDLLTYIPGKMGTFAGPHDDIITFAVAANHSNIPLHVCNEHRFGFVMMPLDQDAPLAVDLEQIINIKLEAINENDTLYVNNLLEQYVHRPDKEPFGFDKIFMINLVRRPERRDRMLACFDELGMKATVFNAIDGRMLNESTLEKISFMPEFKDPYHKRPMTLGEIGCFLSHYYIWKEIVDKGYTRTLVLEDDIRFESFFRFKVKNVMAEVETIPNWDLVYFGRKRLQENDEPWVEGSNFLVRAGYSYWTLGYALSLNGARKLLDGDPLSRLVPVDEYLPILFDKHPQVAWKGYFPERNLNAFSAAPLLLYPTHYTGERGYISDTEDSLIVKGSITHDDL